MADFFTTTKKGEMFELKAELRSEKEKRKDAVKKVIAGMTVGKDVSGLFPDVLNCMQTDNLELKKLVYLYLINYAKSHPDLTILAVNTFVKDCEHPNPLLRALAVRTMGCIQVPQIMNYLCDPLRKCLQDPDPYVRKTAALTVAKVHHIDARIVEEGGFLELLRDLVNDSNPMVVSNAVAAIGEVLNNAPSEMARRMLSFTGNIVHRMLTALNECNEWGQVFIMDMVATYSPAGPQEAQVIVDRVTSRLAHANAAVVLAAIKVIMHLVDMLPGEVAGSLGKRLAPPLVTLLSAEPEIQYITIRNIKIILQKRPDVLKQELKVFFVKYSDPLYVKLEKLDLIMHLSSADNFAQVVSELAEYSREADIEFVRKSVRCLGGVAVRVEPAADLVVRTLVDLVKTRVSYVVQEAVVAIKDIFRKFPNKYESVMSSLCDNLEILDEPEARAAMVWMLGEYADQIDNAGQLLQEFVDNFEEEATVVQLQLLTAVVKLFLKQSTQLAQSLIQTVLSLATTGESSSPDLRDRAYIYWRLLSSSDPGTAQDIVLAARPAIVSGGEGDQAIDPQLLDILIGQLSTLASVTHRARIDPPPLTAAAAADGPREVESNHRSQEVPAASPIQQAAPNLLADQLFGELSNTGGLASVSPPSAAPPPLNHPDLMNLDSFVFNGGSTQGASASGTQPWQVSGSSAQDLVNIFGGPSSLPPPATPMEVWLSPAQGKGLEIKGHFLRASPVAMEMTLTNNALQAVDNFAIQLNKNSFGLVPASPLQVPGPLLPNHAVTVTVPMTHNLTASAMVDPLHRLQVAIKDNVGVFYFTCYIPLHTLLAEDGRMEPMHFLSAWQGVSPDQEVKYNLPSLSCTLERCTEILNANRIFLVNQRSIHNHHFLYQSMKLINGACILVEFNFDTLTGLASLSLRSRLAMTYQPIAQSYAALLCGSPLVTN